MKKIKICKKSETNKYICHPLAKESLRVWKRLNKQFRLDKFSREAIEMMQKVMPLYVIENKKGEYEYFAGFQLLGMCSLFDVDELMVIKCSKLSDDEIKIMSWMSVFLIFVFDLENKKGLGNLKELMREMLPTNMCMRIFSKKKVTFGYFAEIAGVTKRLIRWQVCLVSKKNKKEKTIYEQIIENNDE